MALASDLEEARAAVLAHAQRAEHADAQQRQREAFLHAHVKEAKRGLATAHQHAEEARRERDFFMSQSTDAATQAASAIAERDAAKQVPVVARLAVLCCHIPLQSIRPIA